jgi:hypothetical protein
VGGDRLRLSSAIAETLSNRGVHSVAWAIVPALTSSHSSSNTAALRRPTFKLLDLVESNELTLVSLVDVLKALCKPLRKKGVKSTGGDASNSGAQHVRVVGDVAASPNALTDVPTIDHISPLRYKTDSPLLQDADSVAMLAVEDTSVLRAHMQAQLEVILKGRSSRGGNAGVMKTKDDLKFWDAVPMTAITLPRQTVLR